MSLYSDWRTVLPDLQMTVPFNLERSVPAVFRVGSHSHGTYVPPEDPSGVDDVDLMVVVIPPPDYVLGLKRFEHAQFKHGRYDVVLYDWAKWLRLIGKSNPNVVGTLWLEPEDVLGGGDSFGPLQTLFIERARLLSQRMYAAFIGYARAQLYKMMHQAHQGYMGEKRKRLVEQFGYDVKNAAHMVRLLRMACETLETGRMHVRRTQDAQMLIDIKQGRWSLTNVQDEAERLFVQAARSLAETTLPAEPDELLLQRMMVAGYRKWWSW